MKALQLVAPSTLAVVELPEPEPGPGEVRLRVKACGICGSDLHGLDGSSGRRIPPLVMGHEASGIIDAIGGGVTAWNAGDRVTFDSTVWCGECDWCQSGRVNLCDSRQVVGVACSEFRRDGAFAEKVIVPDRILHRLPDGLPFEVAAFAEPVGVALHAVARAGEVTGRTVLVVGAGLIGLLVIQALRRAGAGMILAVDLDESRLALARELGANISIVAGNSVPLEVDIAMEVVGAAPTVDLAVRSVRKGGRVVLVGNLAPSVPLPLQLVVTREIEVHGTCAIAGEYPEALAALAAGEIRVEPLISATVPLTEGVTAFGMASAPGALKVLLVDPS